MARKDAVIKGRISLAFVLMCYICGGFILFLYQNVLVNASWSKFVFITIHILSLLIFVSLFESDPGFISKKSNESWSDDDQSESDEEAGITSQAPYCDHCETRVPIRAHHCRDCQRCVAGFDHHCFWVGSCIGAANHRAFWMLVALESIGIPWSFFVMLSALHTADSWLWFILINILPWCMSCTTFFMGVFCLILFFYHSYMVLTNQVQYESTHRHRVWYIPQGLSDNLFVFDHGLSRNLFDFFCFGGFWSGFVPAWRWAVIREYSSDDIQHEIHPNAASLYFDNDSFSCC